MILTNGNLNVRDLLAGNSSGKKITHVVVGTSDAPVTGGETALTGQLSKAVTTVDILPGGEVKFNATLSSADPAMLIKEIGLLNQDGVLVHRKVITPKQKVSGVTYALYYKLKVQ